MTQGKYGVYKINYPDDYKKFMTVEDMNNIRKIKKAPQEYGMTTNDIDCLLDILVRNYKVLSLNLKWTWNRTGEETYFGNQLDISVSVILFKEFEEVRTIDCTFGDICQITSQEDWENRCGYHQIYKFEK